MKKSSASIINGPTILTFVRIILVVPFVGLMFAPTTPARIGAIVCFVIASITDFIDGRWARKAHLVTDLGAFLDPLADKMLINLAFLVLVYQDLIPLWIFAVILVRDFAVDGMRMLSARNGITIAASKIAKWKTTSQMIAIIFILLTSALAISGASMLTTTLSTILTTINDVLLYIALILTIISGIDYLAKGWKQLTKSKAKPSQ